MHKLPAFLLLAAALGLGACTRELAYDLTENWRRNACDGYMGDDRARCLSNTTKSYTDYERERLAAQQKPERRGSLDFPMEDVPQKAP